MGKSFLDKAYAARDAASTRRLYDDWAESYDSEVTGQGYATPARCAKALAKFSIDRTHPILDFGCGTGLSGKALAEAGFNTIDGCDPSPDMLKEAEAKGVYRTLTPIDADGALPHDLSSYAAIAAIGVIGAGAAPISVFDTLMRGLARDALLVFSFNDHALAEKQNEGRVSEWLDCGAGQLLFREHGPHLPGLDLGSNVYIIRKS